MKFTLIDSVLSQTSDRIVAIKQVSLAEEYLADHFPSFPVLPGVLMIEAMVQAARTMLIADDPRNQNLVLGEVKALKFGNMVRPGEALEVQITLNKQLPDGAFEFKGTGVVRKRGEQLSAGETAVSGRFTLRPVRRAAIS